MKLLTFKDFKTKKKFITNEYKIVNKKGKTYAVATSPKGRECWRLVNVHKERINKKKKFEST